MAVIPAEGEEMELEGIRQEINKIDEQMAVLFARRMELAEEAARYKKERGLALIDEIREAEIIFAAGMRAGKYNFGAERLFRTILELSHSYQEKI